MSLLFDGVSTKPCFVSMPLMISSALFITQVFASQNIFITGEIKASDSQIFFAPQSDTWRIQVEWMLPEGEIAKPGDVLWYLRRVQLPAPLNKMK
ncbi:hypothetical protein [Pseudoalteromonas piratica]|uniref:hypothetical protein n=1 Tax=Pseudoalteromonas piratica TaxID=1348114 RepID=UPI001F3F592F|nr:hypothetical protein [Pseudoalteromonas piratica]